MKIVVFLLIAGVLLLQISAIPTLAQEISNTPIESAWFVTTGGGVSAIVTDGTTTYIGGNFSQVGSYIGCGVPIDETSGYPLAVYPKVVNGQINAVVPDGSGGWYIGGTFTQIGDTVRNGIAHINSDGALDAFWDSDSNGPVSALAVSGNTVYAGGSFTGVGGEARSGFAMFGIAYSISGTVEDSGGSPLGGVSMALTGASSATTQTASDGTYAFTGLLSGAYIITPTENQYTFSPQTINASITDSDLVSQDFTGATGATGSLTVTITPAAAVSGGACLCIECGEWNKDRLFQSEKCCGRLKGGEYYHQTRRSCSARW